MLEAPKSYKNGPATVGVFAIQSPVRPSPIALSTVEVIHVDYHNGTIEITYIDANDDTVLFS